MSSTDEFANTASDYLPTVQEVSWMVLALADSLQQNFAAKAADFGLSGAQAKVLINLRPEEALPMRTLAKRLGYDASNLTALVDKLEARGALERRPNLDDRRIKALALTEEGLRLREDFRQQLSGDAGPLTSLEASQVRELRELLRVTLGQV